MYKIKQINNSLLNKQISFFGWVKKIRKLGEITFIDLYDQDQLIQVKIIDEIDISIIKNYSDLSLNNFTDIYLLGDTSLNNNTYAYFAYIENQNFIVSKSSYLLYSYFFNPYFNFLKVILVNRLERGNIIHSFQIPICVTLSILAF